MESRFVKNGHWETRSKVRSKIGAQSRPKRVLRKEVAKPTADKYHGAWLV